MPTIAQLDQNLELEVIAAKVAGAQLTINIRCIIGNMLSVLVISMLSIRMIITGVDHNLQNIL